MPETQKGRWGISVIERPDVDALMAGALGQWLQSQTTMREQAKAKTVNRRWLVVGAIACGAVFALIALQAETTTILGLGGVAGMIGWAWAEGPKRRAIRVVKERVNDAIADALGITYEHDCEAGEPFELVKICKLVPRHDLASFEDRWSGHFGDVRFMVHEAKLEEQRSSGKSSYWVTVFQGLIMAVSYHRRFAGTTVLMRDNAHRGFFGTKKDHITVKDIRLDYAAMVHPDFEDAFDVYTSDQVEARALIDPAYIERLIALEQSYHGKDIATIFHQGSLLVALKAENMFESGAIDAKDDRARLQTTIDQFGKLADLAATLNCHDDLPGAFSRR